MTALTSNITRPHKSPPGGTHCRTLPLIGYTNKAGGNTAHEVYKGSFVFYDANDAEGYRRIVTANQAAVADTVGGIAIERQSVTSEILADAQKYVTVAVDGVWAFPIESITIADVGKDIYLSDDNLATVTVGTYNLWIGKLAFVDATYAWVDIKSACGKLNVAPT